MPRLMSLVRSLYQTLFRRKKIKQDLEDEFIAVACSASFIPARRATRVDPHFQSSISAIC